MARAKARQDGRALLGAKTIAGSPSQQCFPGCWILFQIEQDEIGDDVEVGKASFLSRLTFVPI